MRTREEMPDLCTTCDFLDYEMRHSWHCREENGDAGWGIYFPDWWEEKGNGLLAYYECDYNHEWTCGWSRSREPEQTIKTRANPPRKQVATTEATSAGSIYIARCGRFHKIGHSVTPGKRIASLQTGSPEPIILVGTIPGSRDDEQEWHRQFRSKRVHGEWFDLSEEEVQIILSKSRKEITELP